jgi:hypothetical protein
MASWADCSHAKQAQLKIPTAAWAAPPLRAISQDLSASRAGPLRGGGRPAAVCSYQAGAVFSMMSALGGGGGGGNTTRTPAESTPVTRRVAP